MPSKIAKEVIARDGAGGVSRVYLSESLDDIEARWRFYLAKYGRDDLWQRTWIVDAGVRHGRVLTRASCRTRSTRMRSRRVACS